MTMAYWTYSWNEKKRFFFWSWRNERSKEIKKENSLDHDMVKLVEDLYVVEK